jgi:hypothetical protein
MKINFTCCFVLAAIISFSQAGNVGIGTNAPLARLHVADSSVLFSASGPVAAVQGSPPISGQGRRLMWYPDKAALRAGYVKDTRWDKDSIGDYSFAPGYNNMAKGMGSFAMGANSIATGDYATALGQNNIASAYLSTALGSSATANGIASVAIGAGTNASGFNSIAVGSSTTSSGRYSTALGYSTNANGDYATAMGANTQASGNSATSTGSVTLAAGNYATAMGIDTKATGTASTAMGFSTTASGRCATAMGYANEAPSAYETVIGSYAKPYVPASATSISENDRLFVIGNGTSINATSNAVTVLKNGNTGIGTATPAAKLEVAGTFKSDTVNTASLNTTSLVAATVGTSMVTTPTTGANNMLAAAYGLVYGSGVLQTSSGNCAINTVHTTGTYIITFTSSNLSNINIGNLPVVISLYGGAPGFITWSANTNGSITVLTFNSSGVLTDRGFGFAVYKP